MNSDLLAMLRAGDLGGTGSGNRRDANSANEAKTLLSFKAGKMTATMQPNGKYLIQPDARRGLIQVLWTTLPASSAGLKIDWKDRRTQTVVDSLRIFPQDQCTYSKVDTGRDKDRVYLLQFGNASDRRFFFWMQDREEDREEVFFLETTRVIAFGGDFFGDAFFFGE